MSKLDAECERLRKLAHDAPLNPYRLDADGHRWVEQQSNAWARHGRAWMDACEKRDRLSALTKAEGHIGQELAPDPERRVNGNANGDEG